MIILLAVISVVVTALSVRELLKRARPRTPGDQAFGELLDDAAPLSGSWLDLLSLVLPRTLRRLWHGLLLMLFSVMIVGMHILVILQFSDGNSPDLIKLLLYCGSLLLVILVVSLPMAFWRAHYRAS